MIDSYEFHAHCCCFPYNTGVEVKRLAGIEEKEEEDLGFV